jgi:hypothetical protein
LKIGYIGSLKWKRNSAKGYFRHIFTYVQIKHSYTIPYMYMTTEEENSSHEKMYYNYSKKMSTRRAKPIQIIGDPDNQRPDK